MPFLPSISICQLNLQPLDTEPKRVEETFFLPDILNLGCSLESLEELLKQISTQVFPQNNKSDSPQVLSMYS